MKRRQMRLAETSKCELARRVSGLLPGRHSWRAQKKRQNLNELLNPLRTLPSARHTFIARPHRFAFAINHLAFSLAADDFSLRFIEEDETSRRFIADRGEAFLRAINLQRVLYREARPVSS